MSDYIDCAALSLELDEDMAGTAPTERGVLVVEVPGPWGREVLTESSLGEDLGTRIAAKAKAAGLRVQGVRRQPRRYVPDPVHAWVAGLGPQSRFLEAFELASAADLLDLDLSPDRPTGVGSLEAEPLFLVCTHSTRDACCARRGLPLCREVARAAPGRTWHSSHLGGHRFAATMAVLPMGAWLGRVTPDRAEEVVGACRDGRVPVELLRGMAGHAPVVQAAEIELRRREGIDALDGLRIAGHEGDTVRIDGWELAMRHVPTGAPRPFSCGHGTLKEDDPGRWEATRVSRAAA